MAAGVTGMYNTTGTYCGVDFNMGAEEVLVKGVSVWKAWARCLVCCSTLSTNPEKLGLQFTRYADAISAIRLRMEQHIDEKYRKNASSWKFVIEARRTSDGRPYIVRAVGEPRGHNLHWWEVVLCCRCTTSCRRVFYVARRFKAIKTGEAVLIPMITEHLNQSL